MRLLLDTHVLLWWAGAPQRLSPKTLDLLIARRNRVFLSAASVVELAIKVAAKKLRLPEPLDEYVVKRRARFALGALDVTDAHAAAVAALPQHHRDPFDRVLVAQAQVEKLTLVTADDKLGRYDVEILEA